MDSGLFPCGYPETVHLAQTEGCLAQTEEVLLKPLTCQIMFYIIIIQLNNCLIVTVKALNSYNGYRYY